MRRLSLYIFIFAFLGAILGLLLPPVGLMRWIAEIFLRLLRMIVVPLVLVSLTQGVVSLGDFGQLRRLSVGTFIYYLSTSSLSILTGLFLVNLIHPGRTGVLAGKVVEKPALPTVGSLLARIIPENPFQALIHGEMLAIIFLALLIGTILLSLGEEKTASLRRFLEESYGVVMEVTRWVLWVAPLGILALVAQAFQKGGWETMKALSYYFLTVFLGLSIHALITLPLILFLLGKRNPWRYGGSLFPALATAISTASSQATLPLTMECVEDRGGIPPKISAFVLPLGATINMDGTALYEAVAACFIAQCYGLNLSLSQQGMIFLTALLVSIGAAGIPMAGLVMMSIVLKSVGLPLEGVGLIIGVDRFLDMLRTGVNVWSDSVGAAVIARRLVWDSS